MRVLSPTTATASCSYAKARTAGMAFTPSNTNSAPILLLRLARMLLEELLEIGLAHVDLVRIGLGEGAVIEIDDPLVVVINRAILGEGEIHQAARRLPGHVVARKQEMAEHRLRLALAFVGCEPHPARRHHRIARP